ncbi:MAG: cobalamin-dependent protein [Anaerolineales bacterium]
MMLQGAGFEIIELGTDVPPAKFVEAVRDSGAAIVRISALLTTTMRNMSSVIEALGDMGFPDKVKVMDGGDWQLSYSLPETGVLAGRQ